MQYTHIAINGGIKMLVTVRQSLYESSSILYFIMNKTQKCSSCRSKSSVHEVPGPLSCGDNCSDFYRLLKLYRHFTAASAFQASDRFRAPPLRVTRCQICQRGCSSCDSPFSSRLHMWSITTVNIFFYLTPSTEEWSLR